MHSHIIVTGPGRSGTTLLMHILTKLGQDTGFDPDSAENEIDSISHAGLEFHPTRLMSPKSARVVKSPFFCNNLEAIIRTSDVRIDHAIVCLRESESIGLSRQLVSSQHCPIGGYWNASNPEDQARYVEEATYNLFLILAEYAIPVTALRFPKFARNPGYLWRQLSRDAFPSLNRDAVVEIAKKVVRPEWIHF